MLQSIRLILKEPLIGKYIQIYQHTDTGLIGIEGKVEDESKFMIKINNKWVQKKGGVFFIKIKNGKIKVQGNLLLGLSRARRKKKLKTF